MVVAYDDETGGFVIDPDFCDCGEPLADTGCDAPGCSGRSCVECGTGCDIEFAPDDGRCARRLAEESDEEYEARIDRERSAFGLSPVRDLPSHQGGAA